MREDDWSDGERKENHDQNCGARGRKESTCRTARVSASYVSSLFVLISIEVFVFVFF